LKKLGTTKRTKRSAWSLPPPSPPLFSLKCFALIIKKNQIHTHKKEREEKLKCEPPYIG
jgi:hypothetical protein